MGVAKKGTTTMSMRMSESSFLKTLITSTTDTFVPWPPPPLPMPVFARLQSTTHHRRPLAGGDVITPPKTVPVGSIVAVALDVVGLAWGALVRPMAPTRAKVTIRNDCSRKLRGGPRFARTLLMRK